MQYESSYLHRGMTFEHHGIKGQKWGVRNGPPYPLTSNVSTGKVLKKIAKSANKHFKSNLSSDYAKPQNQKAIRDIKSQRNVQNRVNSDQDMYNDVQEHLDDTDRRYNSMMDKTLGSKEFGEWLKKSDYKNRYQYSEADYGNDILAEKFLKETNKEYQDLVQERRKLSNEKIRIINDICDDICGEHMYEKIGDFAYQSADYVKDENGNQKKVSGMTRATNAAVTQLLEENYESRIDELKKSIQK